ncbi:MAG: exopolysaccharide biosynthesis protein [Verrucomicrobia bacterium]|nr:exopolysaccharide biosynthesis protein [Verrucomicrobiota bacterium]
MSQELLELLGGLRPEDRLSLNDVFLRTEGRGLFLFIIVLCLPFVTPISIPGMSNALGVVLILLGIRLAFGLAPCLPPWIGDRPLPPGFQKVLRASTRVVRFLERWARPRKDKWAQPARRPPREWRTADADGRPASPALAAAHSPEQHPARLCHPVPRAEHDGRGRGVDLGGLRGGGLHLRVLLFPDRHDCHAGPEVRGAGP